MQDEVVLITGASSGIGEQAVRKFIAAGARVIGAARRLDRLEALRDELGERFWPLALDVTRKEEVGCAIDGLQPPFDRISILLNNAGAAFGLDPAHAASLDDWEAMVDVNIKGVLYVTHKVLPGMVERNRGYVINLGSVAGTYPYKGGHVYGASKAFLEQFSLNLRADLIGKRVRVTNIEPGMVETDFSLVRFRGDASKAQAVYERFEALTPGDIADLIFYCATLPDRVNINRLEVMPVMQSFAGFAVERNKDAAPQ